MYVSHDPIKISFLIVIFLAAHFPSFESDRRNEFRFGKLSLSIIQNHFLTTWFALAVI